ARAVCCRAPPPCDGHARSPLPRFTTLDTTDRQRLRAFFLDWGTRLSRVLVPGANVVVPTTPLAPRPVGAALDEAGLQRRGEIVRLVQTLRGGDRPKNAHREFPDV